MICPACLGEVGEFSAESRGWLRLEVSVNQAEPAPLAVQLLGAGARQLVWRTYVRTYACSAPHLALALERLAAEARKVTLADAIPLGPTAGGDEVRAA